MKRQSRLIFGKTILPLDSIISELTGRWSSATVVGATHPAEGETPEHCHFVVRFSAPIRWDDFAFWLQKADSHCYVAPGQSWRRCVRYCLHLDNPEKVSISRNAVRSVGIDDSELDTLLGSSKLPILESLILAQRLPLSQRFQFLVCERRHNPSEVASALRCMRELEKWEDSRTARALGASALPDGIVESDSSTPEELEESGLFYEDGKDFYA